MRRSSSTAAALIALFIAAPAANARPATDTAASGTQLTLGQLHRIDGNQSPAIAPAAPVEPTPVKTSSTPDDTGLWILVSTPLALGIAAGALRKATHRTLIPRGGSHAHA
jgi:hypothetical protein